MSVVTLYRQVSPEIFAEIEQNPANLEYFLYRDEEAHPVSEEFKTLVDEAEEFEEIDTDKAWMGIWFLLKELSSEGGLSTQEAVLGSKVIRQAEYEEDIIRYCNPSEVKSFAQALEGHYLCTLSSTANPL